MRVIVALSGGKASAWCAFWAIQHFRKEDIVLYFNDTRWEHPDLYRFLEDMEQALGVTITRDSDGRTPEQVFMDNHLMGNSRIAICSRILKAERLQKFYTDGDILVFGIGPEEAHRAQRLVAVYQKIAVQRKVYPLLRFPLIEDNVDKAKVDEWLSNVGVKQPLLYDLGFQHNNCSGGCVRAGKKHWAHLLSTLPEVYQERERMECSFRVKFGNYTILKNETLTTFRERMTAQKEIDFDETDSAPVECIGICDLID